MTGPGGFACGGVRIAAVQEDCERFRTPRDVLLVQEPGER